ncbi:MAG: AAA family ATPase [archaeon]|nr:AAA family ATPase [archaeon]
MADNIFEKSSKLVHILRDERFLYPEFVPEKLVHRDREIDELVYAFNPVVKGQKPLNVVLLGAPGTGKTVTSKYVLNQLQEYSDRAKSLYINCFEFNTRTSILSMLVNFLGSPVPRRGRGTDEVYQQLLSSLEKSSFVPLIILDEVDQLIAKEDGEKTLYDLLRVIEFKKIHLGLIIISNDFAFTSKLDARIKSSLGGQTIVFNPYTPKQLKDILWERCEKAFSPNAVEEDAVNVAAAHSAKMGGDARVAIDILLKAGRLAEKNNEKMLKLVHVREIIDSSSQHPLERILPFLSDAEKIVLKILAQREEIEASELFNQYSHKVSKPLTQRHFLSLISRLESLNLVKTLIVERANKGRGKNVLLNIPKESILEQLKQK